MGKHKRSKSEEKKKKKRKRRHSSSSSESSSVSSFDASPAKRKVSKKCKKDRKKKSKKSEKSELPSIDEIIAQKLLEKGQKRPEAPEEKSSTDLIAPKPMTKEEYDKKQSVVRRVFDPDTGRSRLVKGDGEIIEEIVSASRQKEINKSATLGDGQSFQALLQEKL